jgi:hypothetical protein
VLAIPLACKQVGSLRSSSNSNPVPNSNKAPKTASAQMDVCALVTNADAESILGIPVKLNDHEPDDQFASHCAYQGVDLTKGFSGLQVEVDTDEDADAAKTNYEIAKKIYSNFQVYNLESLSGVGDEAFLAVSKLPEQFNTKELSSRFPQQQILVVTKNTKSLKLMSSLSGGTASSDSLKAVGKKLADGF